MELVVDLEKVTVVLADPDDVGSLRVRVAAPPDASVASPDTVHRLHDVLEATHVGRLHGGAALIRADALAFHAAGGVGHTWDRRFAAGVGSAAADEAGMLRAPVVWPDSEGRGPS